MTRPHVPPRQLLRLSVGARLFGTLVLMAPILWSGDELAAIALVAVGAIWLAATAAETLGVNPLLSALIEAVLVGTVAGLALDSSLAVLGALAITPFTISLRRGPRGVLLVLSAEITTVVVLSIALRGTLHADQGSGVFTWIVTGLGLGLIGNFVRASRHEVTDPLTPYRDAQALIRELIDLSGSLSSGLDPLSLGGVVAEAVRDELPVSALVVHVPRGDGLSPLLTETDATTMELLEPLAITASRTLAPAREGGAFAFPLMTDVGLVAVVAGVLPSGLDLDSLQVDARLAEVAERLEPAAVHLDTALLFTAFRDAATSDERRRLAREMHDGVAQDIASLGYLVDALTAAPATPQQAAQLRALRARITAVVAEVRRNVQSLRTEVGGSESLGTAIGRLARHLSASSGIPIHVTVEERTTRLRIEVEAELLRIAQEAMTNAVRHSGATRIEVTCRVRAPEAEITVLDNGRGVGPARHDSQGIEIMHERARLVGADLTLVNRRPQGTGVTVRLLGAPPVSAEEPGESKVNA